MAEQNRRATGAFVNQLAGTSLEANKCPVKTLIESTGKVIVDGNYTSTQLVKETSIIKIGLYINTRVVLVNFGNSLINSIIVEFKNSTTGGTNSIYAGGIFPNGSSRPASLREYIYAEGSGRLTIGTVMINEISLGGSEIASKMNLRVKTSSSNLPQPTTWGTLSLLANTFVGNTAIPQEHIQIDIKW